MEEITPSRRTRDNLSKALVMPEPQTPEFFETRSIPKLLLEFSAPAIVASLVTASYNLVARIFVAQRFGTDGVAAVTVSFPIILIFLAVAMTIGVGTTILISIRLGEHKLDKAEEALGQALFLSVATSAIFIAFGQIFMEPILVFIGASETVLPLAKSYLSVVLWGVLTQHIAYGVNNFIRAEGKPRIAMVTMLISAFMNALLDYVFLFVLRTGIWGAGLANVLACAVAAAWVGWLYLSGRTTLKWRWKYFRFNWPLTKLIAITGASPFVTQACSAILQTASNNLMGKYGRLYGESKGFDFDGGDFAIAIMGAAIAIINMFIMPFLGLGQGVQPIVGYNFGAKRPDRTLETITTAIFYALVLIAAISSAISLIEAVSVTFIDHASAKGHERDRNKVLAVVCLAITLLACLVAVDGLGSNGIAPKDLFHINSKADWCADWLDFMDMISEGIAMPLGAMLMSIMVGWEIKPKSLYGEIDSGYNGHIHGFYTFCIKYLCPVIMFFILLVQISTFFGLGWFN